MTTSAELAPGVTVYLAGPDKSVGFLLEEKSKGQRKRPSQTEWLEV